MNNFGVIELASTKTTHAPGWAYVPDVAPSTSAVVPGNRKRAARNHPAASGADLSARFDAKVRKEIEALDRDNARDINIVVPGKGNRLTSTKHTPNVRKILQSAKTFANHLDDFAHTLEHNPQAAFFPLPPPLSGAAAASSHSKHQKKPRSRKKEPANSSARTRDRGKGKGKGKDKAQDQEIETTVQVLDGDGDGDGGGGGGGGVVEGGGNDNDLDINMPDAPPQSSSSSSIPPLPLPKIPLLSPLPKDLIPQAHPSDTDPLLMSRVPLPPTAEEIEFLVTARPLPYAESRARWPAEQENAGTGTGAAGGGGSLRAIEACRRRRFCDVCGYWGKIRCSRCGSRVCALDCLEMHRDGCVSRYGF